MTEKLQLSATGQKGMSDWLTRTFRWRANICVNLYCAAHRIPAHTFPESNVRSGDTSLICDVDQLVTQTGRRALENVHVAMLSYLIYEPSIRKLLQGGGDTGPYITRRIIRHIEEVSFQTIQALMARDSAVVRVVRDARPVSAGVHHFETESRGMTRNRTHSFERCNGGYDRIQRGF